MIMNKNDLLRANILFDIDIQIADFFCRQGRNDEQTWMLAALTSFFTNLKNTAFSPQHWVNKTLADLPLDLDTQLAHLQIPDFTTFDYQTLSQPQKELIAFRFNCYYLRRFLDDELFVAQSIINRMTQADTQLELLKPLINKSFENQNPDGTPNAQKIAAILALKNNFTVISGGPGTGKTTTVGKILTLLLHQHPNLKIALLAPTGKAADRLKESIVSFKNSPQNQVLGESVSLIPEETYTIQRFLSKNQNMATEDLILVDESGMVSCPLFAELFRKISPNARLILLGDKDQLDTIESGTVLSNLISHCQLNQFSPTTTALIKKITDNQLNPDSTDSTSPLQDFIINLYYSHRFSTSGGIGILSKHVNQMQHNNPEQTQKIFVQFPETIAHHTQYKTIHELIPQLLSHLQAYKKAIENRDLETAFNELSATKILCPTRHGEFGVNTINKIIEKQLFPDAMQSFFHGKAILINKNDHETGIFNGDIGILWQDSPNAPILLKLKQNNAIRSINPVFLNNHCESAFALSIHKSQGSEFKHVHIVLPNYINPIMTKSLLYTAITRAKNTCQIYDPNNLFDQIAITVNERISNLDKQIQLLKKA